MQIVSFEDNLHEMSTPIFWDSRKNISKYYLLNFLPSILCINKRQLIFFVYYLNPEAIVPLNLDFRDLVTAGEVNSAIEVVGLLSLGILVIT